MTSISFDGSSDLCNEQAKFVKALAQIAKRYDVVIILIAHPKKTQGEFTNDSVSGSSVITDAVDVVMNYQRCFDGVSDSKLTVTKNRLTGKLILDNRAVGMQYSEKSKRIESSEHYVENKEYSCFKKVITEDTELPF